MKTKTLFFFIGLCLLSITVKGQSSLTAFPLQAGDSTVLAFYNTSAQAPNSRFYFAANLQGQTVTIDPALYDFDAAGSTGYSSTGYWFTGSKIFSIPVCYNDTASYSMFINVSPFANEFQVLYYADTDGQAVAGIDSTGLSYGFCGAGFGGGGAASITAYNLLTKVGTDSVKAGGFAVENTDFNMGAFDFRFLNSAGNWRFRPTQIASQFTSGINSISTSQSGNIYSINAFDTDSSSTTFDVSKTRLRLLANNNSTSSISNGIVVEYPNITFPDTLRTIYPSARYWGNGLWKFKNVPTSYLEGLAPGLDATHEGGLIYNYLTNRFNYWDGTQFVGLASSTEIADTATFLRQQIKLNSIQMFSKETFDRTRADYNYAYTPPLVGGVMRDWLIRKGAKAGKNLSVALIGDSNVNNSSIIFQYLRHILQSKYGGGGMGWIDISTGAITHRPDDKTNVETTQLGTWDFRDPSKSDDYSLDANGRYWDAGDGFKVAVSDDSWENPAVQRENFINAADSLIFMCYDSTGGSQIRIASTNPSVIDTFTTVQGFNLFEQDQITYDLHSFTIEVLSGGIDAIAVISTIKEGRSGVTVHRIGHGGYTASGLMGIDVFVDGVLIQNGTDFRKSGGRVPQDIIASQLQAIDPDLVIFAIGANSGTALEAYISLDTLMGAYRQELPNRQFLLIGDADKLDDGAINQFNIDQDSLYYELSKKYDARWGSRLQLLGEYSDGDERGVYKNNTPNDPHYSGVGSFQVASWIVDEVLKEGENAFRDKFVGTESDSVKVRGHEISLKAGSDNEVILSRDKLDISLPSSESGRVLMKKSGGVEFDDQRHIINKKFPCASGVQDEIISNDFSLLIENEHVEILYDLDSCGTGMRTYLNNIHTQTNDALDGTTITIYNNRYKYDGTQNALEIFGSNVSTVVSNIFTGGWVRSITIYPGQSATFQIRKDIEDTNPDGFGVVYRYYLIETNTQNNRTAYMVYTPGTGQTQNFISNAIMSHEADILHFLVYTDSAEFNYSLSRNNEIQDFPHLDGRIVKISNINTLAQNKSIIFRSYNANSGIWDGSAWVDNVTIPANTTTTLLIKTDELASNPNASGEKSVRYFLIGNTGESQTLQDVTNLGATTTNAISTGNITVNNQLRWSLGSNVYSDGFDIHLRPRQTGKGVWFLSDSDGGNPRMYFNWPNTSTAAWTYRNSSSNMPTVNFGGAAPADAINMFTLKSDGDVNVKNQLITTDLRVSGTTTLSNVSNDNSATKIAALNGSSEIVYTEITNPYGGTNTLQAFADSTKAKTDSLAAEIDSTDFRYTYAFADTDYNLATYIANNPNKTEIAVTIGLNASGPTSNAILTLPTPAASLAGTVVRVKIVDLNATYNCVIGGGGTNTILDASNSTSDNITAANGDAYTLVMQENPIDSTYYWTIY